MATRFYTATTLDGFIATADHSLDWLFEHDFDLEGPMAYPAFVAGVGGLVMGASTYEWLLRNQEGWGYEQPTWVMTHRELPVPDGADVRFASGGVEEVHAEAEAAANGKDVWVVGGGDLAGQFADAGLLDELWVQFAPVTLGAGRPLLPRALRLELIEHARNRDFVCVRYRVLRSHESQQER
jgi:dihydrofolate reductase